MTDLSTYVNKSVEFKFSGAELRFDLSHALFSSFDVDQGTRLLLKTVARDPVLARADRILDEGCGVGVIGLCMAKAFPQAEVVLRDRDSLAVAFTEHNRLANKLRGTSAWKDPVSGAERIARPAPRVEWGLLGDGRESGDRAEGDFNFVLSNLPAKAGAPVLASFFKRLSGKKPGSGPAGGALLVPGGRAGIVIVNPLADAAALWIAEAGLSVVAEERGSGHHVYVVERPAEGQSLAEPSSAPAAPDSSAASLSPALADYLRCEERFKLADYSYRAHGFWGLSEFDTPSYGSSVAAEVASRALGECPKALFLNPGVGHLALWAAKKLGVRSLTAASRDALSLAATGANIAALPERSRPGYASIDALCVTDLPELSFDLVAEAPDVVPERDWIGPSWELAERLVRPGGAYLAVCSPTEMTRLEKRRPVGQSPAGGGKARWSEACRRRKKGFVATVWIRG